jgi:predicted ATPase
MMKRGGTPEGSPVAAELEVTMTDPVLKSLIVRRFRSIPAETVHFDNPTFLVGHNGSGKSNVRDAVDFLAEAMSSPLQSAFKRRGGISIVRNRTPGKSYPTNLGLGAILGRINGSISGARYSFEIKAHKDYGFEVIREQCLIDLPEGTAYFDRRRGKVESNVEGVRPSLEPDSLGLPIISGESTFAPVVQTLARMRSYAIDPSKLRGDEEANGAANLRPDGSNLASVLQEIGRRKPDDLARIGELLAAVVPNTTNVATVKRENRLALEFTQEWGQRKRLKFKSLSMSDGTLRALGLLVAVYQCPTPSVLVIEEPEATIHPGALGAILDLIRHASRQMQVIVTTHSPEVLDAEWLREENLRIVTWEEGATRVLPLAIGTRESLREHLAGPGELLRSNALRPTQVAPGIAPEAILFQDVRA